jgi:hypothetical protein
MGLHDVLKLHKHGYSKVTDHACREIRFGRISREQGLSLVRKHEQAPAKYVTEFCEWLGINPHALQFVLREHCDRRFWVQDAPQRWRFAGWSTRHPDTEVPAQHLFSEANFIATGLLERGMGPQYITIGKGHP